jgi:tRNA U34 5-methylaminomethyl-2-thiouridine-forming methyltransferase MnmC
MNHLKIITTSDGSHSLLNTNLNETYHSVHGAMRESIHVFITNGLAYFNDKYQPTEIDILEIGFGTGLNAFLTLKYALEKNIGVRYTTLESNPLPPSIWSALNLAADKEDKKYFASLHEAEWGKEEWLQSNFSVLKINRQLQDFQMDTSHHIVYFDAFAPNKQPEMWSLSMLEKVCRGIKHSGIFVTYSAKGQLKRDLRSLGFFVETLAGPPGKKEMVRALKI